ncbi:MAG: cyclase family protein [Dehalococcoidia bacterium]|nr:cyclase family protein [Dehalococcoidia bacterium]
MPIYDVSVPIRNDTIIFPGDPAVRVERVQRMADGAIANLTSLSFGAHTGTHIDAPNHFLDDAPGIEAIPLERLRGPALVVDATAQTDHLDAAAFARLAIPPGTTRLVVKTRNSTLWERATFSDSFIGITESGAAWLIAQGVQLLGVDYLSCAPIHAPTPTHVALLRAGVVIVESLDLRRVPPGAYELVCLPLLIPGSDGGPARALLIGE